MLAHLSVKDVALIEQVELDLLPGLTVLTGETGAGKSILVEALLLVLGARASADVVRSGAPEGSVQAQFTLCGEDAAELARILDEAGLPAMEHDGDEHALVIRRVISSDGRHRQLVNGALCTVAQLKRIAEPLVDFTGQHAHQNLLRPLAGVRLVDGYGQHPKLLAEMHEAYTAARALVREQATLAEAHREKERRLDVIRFYLDEIRELAPVDGEDATLAAEQRRLANVSRLRAAVDESLELLTAQEGDALSLLQRAAVALGRAAEDDAALSPLLGTLDEGIALVDDVVRSLARARVLEADPERLAMVDDRLAALRKLAKKHGGDLASVLRAQATLSAEAALLEGASTRLAELASEIQRSAAVARRVAEELHARRRVAAKKLASAVEGELATLGMPQASFNVTFGAPAASDDALAGVTALGFDDIEIELSANPGEAAKPLAKVASGGELSRVLLAVKRTLLARDPVPVSVFDEVDAGVGGAIGEAIGEKLAAIADAGAPGVRRQVLCISHLPQIAALASNHLVVKKAVAKGRTQSQVIVLGEQDRVEELARMLGGREITEATRAHARELLARGSQPIAKRKKKSA